MRFLVILFAGVLVSVPATAQTTVAEVVDRFSKDLPVGAPDPGEWMLAPLSSTVTIDGPTTGNLLDEHVVSTNFCLPTGLCTFRLSALAYERHPGRTDSPVVLRYLMERGGMRVEGYARYVRGSETGTCFRRQNGGPWVPLSGQESVTELRFAEGTRHYARFWHAALQ